MRAPSHDLPIVLEKVGFRAGAVTILDDISLTLNAGGTTILIGPNGACKTTLLRLLMGLAPASQGRLAWGGREGAAPERLSMVFQRPVMLQRSAAANVLYALSAAGVPRSERAARCAALLQTVGLSGLARRPARRLSGGEQQRLALARALARDPSVLFLDEPTASLDPAGTKAIEDLVQTIAARGVKVIMSTHDLGQARRLADDIVLLHRGRVVEHASTNSFFTAPATEEARTFIAGELLL